MVENECLSKLQDVSRLIKEVNSEIKFVAINAAIESARARATLDSLTETILNQTMVGQCRMIAKMFNDKSLDCSRESLHRFITWIGMDEIWITDNYGVVTHTNNSSGVGWRFPDDPKEQAYAFRALLGKPDAIVCQNVQRRSLDGKLFKFVGVSKIDQQGIIQLGASADNIFRNNREISSVFSALSNHINDLSEKLAISAKDIAKSVQEFEKL